MLFTILYSQDDSYGLIHTAGTSRDKPALVITTGISPFSDWSYR